MIFDRSSQIWKRNSFRLFLDSFFTRSSSDHVNLNHDILTYLARKFPRFSREKRCTKS